MSICWKNLCFHLLALTILFGLASSSTYEKLLLTNLLTNYSTTTRPAVSNHEATTVFFDFKLNKIVKLDIKEQEIVVNSRTLIVWKDPALIWNETEYNNTAYINVPSTKIWTPDILLYNTASETSQAHTDLYKAFVRLKSNGDVIWMSPVTLKASCSINVKWFPFDQQTCTLTFGSISHTKERLHIRFYKQPGNVAAVKGQFHFSSGIWNLKSLSSKLHKKTYDCCKEPFSLIDFTIILDRLPAYWILYLVLPCICLSIVSLCTFFIPPETGERIGFCITVVLAMSVYLLVISDKLPEKSDNKPLIGVLYIILFLIMTLILVFTVFTTHLAFKVTKPPRRLRHLFCRVCQKRKHKKQGIGIGRSEQPKTVNAVENDVAESIDLGRREDGLVTLSHRGTVIKKNSLHQRFSFFTEEDEREMKNQEQWREIAERLDRIGFWIFVVFTLLAPGIAIGIYAA